MAKLIAIILGVALHLASVIAHADVPTIGDMSACNQEAREGYRNRSASPGPAFRTGTWAGPAAGRAPAIAAGSRSFGPAGVGA